VTARFCVFCRKFGGHHSPQHRAWYDHVLVNRDQLVTVAGLGPPSEGYLLLLTEDHYLSISQLPSQLLRAFERLKKDVASILSNAYSPPTFFEHGAGTPTDRAGGCIDHAHLHVIPTTVDLLLLLRANHRLDRMYGLADLQRFEARPYVYYEAPNGDGYAGEAPQLPGQYFRRLISAAMGTPDTWDYTLFPNHELMRATIGRLTPWPPSTFDTGDIRRESAQDDSADK
jgi:diadenosine tetraphosphate (Ap4A) HIT family hydrolase